MRLNNFENLIPFAERYIKLCKQFKDNNNGVTLKSKEIKSFDFLAHMKVRASEKVVFQDWKKGKINLRLIISYAYGIISCSYVKWQEEETGNESLHFEEIAESALPIDFNRLSIKYPIATDTKSFGIILQELISLHEMLFPQINLNNPPLQTDNF